MLILTLLLVAALSAIAHLRGEYRGPAALIYVAKPLTTMILTGLALAAPAADRGYRIAIVIGLVFSLAGDVFLILPHDRFILGLASFLIAHVAYILAFGRGVSVGSHPLLLAPYVIVAAIVLRQLWPRLGRSRVPVVVYVAALVAMAWFAASRAATLHSAPSYAAAAGAALFVASDATLAWNRFHTRFHAAQAVVMSTYVIAQACIALSVHA